LGLAPPVARPWTPCIIVLIVTIWNVLDVNRLVNYTCVCLTRVASTEIETVGNDSCSIPEEEELSAIIYNTSNGDVRRLYY
jgi:hypothetical protein